MMRALETTRIAWRRGASVALFLIFGLGIVPRVQAAKPAVESSEARETARRHLARATKLRRAGRDAEAYVELEKAWSRSRSFDIACNLGHTALDLKRYRDAAEHLDYCVRFHLLSNQRDLIQREQRARAALEQVRARVGSIEVSVEPSGAEVWIDQRFVGQAPLAAPLFVEPGEHRVTVTLQGFAPSEYTVNAVLGRAERLDVQLEQVELNASTSPSGPVPRANPNPDPPEAPPPITEQPLTHAPSAPDHTLRTTVLLIGGGAAALAAGVGTALFVTAQAAERDADRHRQATSTQGETGCGANPSATACADLRDAFQRRDRDAKISTAAFITAGALSVGTAAFWLLWRPSPAEQSQARRPKPPSPFRIQPGFAPGQATLWISGPF